MASKPVLPDAPVPTPASAALPTPKKQTGAPATNPTVVSSRGTKSDGGGGSGTIPRSEKEGIVYAGRVLAFLKKHQAVFFQGEEEQSPRVLLNNQLVSLNFEVENDQLAQLIQHACQVSSLCPGAKAAIQRLRVHALSQAGSLHLRQFSAISEDLKELYLPHPTLGQSITLTPGAIKTVSNGNNTDKVWIVHPYGQSATYLPNTELKPALELLEKLCVETQSCVVPELRWFVAINEGIFPYVRDLCPARFLTVHKGKHQQGKTTGAQRHTMLLGLGQVKGDYSIAALNHEGDIGLLVLDNKEQDNFDQKLRDYCLYLATGAGFGRASRAGHVRRSSPHRPVGVLTTIEGVYTDELSARSLTIEYDRTGSPGVMRAYNEADILKARNQIYTGTLTVLQRFLGENFTLDPTIAGFEEHFSAVCNLFRITAELLQKPSKWAEDVIAVWKQVFTNKPYEENELEYPINCVLKRLMNGDYESEAEHQITYDGKRGTLFVLTCSQLFGWVQSQRIQNIKIPRNPAGFASRLAATDFRSFSVISGKKCDGIKELQRTSDQKFMGLFLPR